MNFFTKTERLYFMKPTIYNDNYEDVPNPSDELHKAIAQKNIEEI